jgi:hypothetical protein
MGEVRECRSHREKLLTGSGFIGLRRIFVEKRFGFKSYKHSLSLQILRDIIYTKQRESAVGGAETVGVSCFISASGGCNHC